MNRPQEIVSTGYFPTAAIVLGLAGAGLLAIGVTQGNPHCSLASVPAIALAGGLLLFRPPQIAGRLEESALVLELPEAVIPYETIESISMAGRPQEVGPKLRRGPVMLVHAAGVLTIPADLNRPVEELYTELLQRAEGSGSRDVHADLKAHVAKEIELFGEDRVWSFRARRGYIGRMGNRRQFVCFLLLAVAAASWCVAPFLLFQPNSPGMAWLGFGVLLGLISLIGMLVTTRSSRLVEKLVPRCRESSMVISPSGIALIQGDLRGQMRWDELRDVRLAPKGVQFGVAPPLLGPLQLVVEGATILVFDIYDRPLPSILKVIRQMRGHPVAA